MKHILIELSPESCNRAVRELKKYMREIRPKVDEVCRRLAEIGRDTAQAIFDSADYGNGGVTVQIAPCENGWKVIATGSDVYFIEFGTGDATSSHYLTDVPLYPGSWSETHAQKYSINGYWYYGGERLTETPAYMPMFNAEKAIRANAKRIVKEVMGR